MIPRYVCVHGHFYQPPRENPWLGAVERQPSAGPFHDWNERITAECYAPNALSRVLTADGRVARLVNNYARISFNFGPTLLSWLEEHDPTTYAAVLAADRQGQERFGGHGPALAQVYNHAIMPLANRRDKLTQIRWGLADFRARFGRAPAGMWLAETAVDIETLDLLAAEGLRFTILSPYQAARVRVAGSDWRDVTGGRIDPTQAYRIALPSGRPFSLFFYDGPTARAIAFEGALQSGEALAACLVSSFTERAVPQLAHVATDGETYGHHKRHGDMALAYALDHIEADGTAKLTIYAEYLEKHPPTDDVEILENSAWSCSHGVGRWREDCGCRIDHRPDWTQQWRGPLRQALDALAEELAVAFARNAPFADPWAARDDYVQVLLDPATRAAFLLRHAPNLSPSDVTRAWQWLECQRHALLMFTSCGWFFDELSGLETVQILQYACRALQLAKLAGGPDLEADFLDKLAGAKSNRLELGDGSDIYIRLARPALTDLTRVALHHALCALFDGDTMRPTWHYRVESADGTTAGTGDIRCYAGRVHLSTDATGAAGSFDVAALHLGDHNFLAGAKPAGLVTDAARADLLNAANSGAAATAVELAQQHYGATPGLAALLGDERERVLARLTEATARQLDRAYSDIYQQHGPQLRYLLGLGAPLPRAFAAAAEYTLNRELLRALHAEPPLRELVDTLLAEATTFQVSLDVPSLSFALTRVLNRAATQWLAVPGRVDDVLALIQWAKRLPFAGDFWSLQNAWFALHAEAKVPGMTLLAIAAELRIAAAGGEMSILHQPEA